MCDPLHCKGVDLIWPNWSHQLSAVDMIFASPKKTDFVSTISLRRELVWQAVGRGDNLKQGRGANACVHVFAFTFCHSVNVMQKFCSFIFPRYEFCSTIKDFIWYCDNSISSRFIPSPDNLLFAQDLGVCQKHIPSHSVEDTDSMEQGFQHFICRFLVARARL